MALSQKNRRTDRNDRPVARSGSCGLAVQPLHRLLELFKGARLDLAHPLAADAEFLAEIFERRRFIFQAPFGDDVALTLVERLHRPLKKRQAQIELALAGELLLGVHGVLVDQPVLPLAAGVIAIAKRRVERGFAAHHPPVHLNDVALLDAELVGDQLDLFGPQIALVDGVDLPFDLAQVEEELFLGGGGADLHETPGAQDVFLDGGLDPPHRVGGEPKALVGVETLDRLHEADIAFGNHLADRQTVAAITHGDFGHEP
jgi:hypothetical protein